MEHTLSANDAFEELLAIRLMLNLGKLSRAQAMDRIVEVLDRASPPPENETAVA